MVYPAMAVLAAPSESRTSTYCTALVWATVATRPASSLALVLVQELMATLTGEGSDDPSPRLSVTWDNRRAFSLTGAEAGVKNEIPRRRSQATVGHRDEAKEIMGSSLGSRPTRLLAGENGALNQPGNKRL
jgi:hypothetical protein